MLKLLTWWRDETSRTTRFSTEIVAMVMSELLSFLLVVNDIMETVEKESPRGIQWGINKKLIDINYVDDIRILTHSSEDLQEKLSILNREVKKRGLKISTKKTEVMKVYNNRHNSQYKIRNNVLKQTIKFCYLGSIARCGGGCQDDIINRRNKAGAAFNNLLPIWNSNKLKLSTKIIIFNSDIKSVVLHDSESRLVSRKITTQLQTFINRCLRRILQVRWTDTISNQDLWRRMAQVEEEFRRRKWGWLGHTLRKPHVDVNRTALEWNPQGPRRIVRPNSTWRRSVQMEAKAVGLNWNGAKVAAKNKVRWWCVVDALCSK
jgi:hypothetical protein